MLTEIMTASRGFYHLGAAGDLSLSHFCPWLGRSCRLKSSQSVVCHGYLTNKFANGHWIQRSCTSVSLFLRSAMGTQTPLPELADSSA